MTARSPIVVTEGSTSLYRAVDSAEYSQIAKTGTFQMGENSLEGKFFAENLVDAQKWGDVLNGPGNSYFVEARMQNSIADQMMRWSKLDGIGPARYGTLDQLQNVDIRMLGQ